VLLDNYNVAGLAAATAITARDGAHTLTLNSASNSRLGTIALSSADDVVPTELVSGDTIKLGYSKGTDSTTVAQSWFVLVQQATSGNTALASRGQSETTLQLAFALGQSEPNPFARSTTIRFELPRRNRVKLVVLDLQGRTVASLADAEFSAGRHAVNWDGRSKDGFQMPAGIYFYRMEAGLFRAQRRMTLLP
jgi:hypothetical protein